MNKFFGLCCRMLVFISTLLLSVKGFAQKKVEMADGMRSNGKIYVVVAVCLVILVGLFVYVAGLDRKIRKLEKDT
jgi:hypothetical protein